MHAVVVSSALHMFERGREASKPRAWSMTTYQKLQRGLREGWHKGVATLARLHMVSVWGLRDAILG